MKATMIRQGAYWAVQDDVGRTIIERESYGIACAVCNAFNYPERWEPTEAYEIAGQYTKGA